MKRNDITNALNMLDDDMVERTYELRTNEKKRAKTISAKRIIALAAAVVAVGSVTAFALSDRGFFSDVKNWRGAITGTEYNNATNEIEFDVASSQNAVVLTASLLYAESAPYKYLEELSFEYIITDYDGKVVAEGTTAPVAISECLTEATIPVESLKRGAYSIEIKKLIGSSKADADLPISGDWKIDFYR